MMFICAPLIPHVIGNSFTRSISALRWLCLLPLFRSFQSAAGDAIIGAGYYKFRTGSQFVAAAVNFGLNLYFIPHYSWVGAAWTSLMTDGGLAVMNWAVLFYLLKRDKKRRLIREAEAQNTVSTEA
jgi:O-antigen/teichoic acid export membrane protein